MRILRIRLGRIIRDIRRKIAGEKAPYCAMISYGGSPLSVAGGREESSGPQHDWCGQVIENFRGNANGGDA